MARNSVRNIAISVVALLSLHLFYTVTYPNVVSPLFRARRLLTDDLPPAAGLEGEDADLARNATDRPRAALFVLTRNGDLPSLRGTMRDVEDRFNRRFQYDWVFLNDAPFTDEFKRYTSSMTRAKTKYGLIPKEHWSYPSWIDQEKARASREQLQKDGVIYGGSESYRHMCRFESGFFFRHELLAEYDYYWRVEPGARLYCDVQQDPFRILKETGKMYGFTIALYEYPKTIPTLWPAVREFMEEHPEHIAEGNALDFISNDQGATYNLCHFWSNFEIASLELWRGTAYMDFFEHLDKKGGFFYERWGDAPVHSIAASLLLKKEQIHFFYDIGYYHVPFHHCPPDPESQLRCVCDVKANFDNEGYSCLPRWKKVAGIS